MRLIDADKLRYELIMGHDLVGAKYTDFAETVDAVPVRHGRWIEVDVGDCCYSCSECGFPRDGYLLDVGNYCPKCGAKMDLEKENGRSK